jgi:DNA (cytosine-5)-methyltransferase 1
MPQAFRPAGRVRAAELSQPTATLVRWGRGTTVETDGKSFYGVRLVRGPFLALPPHEAHCKSDDDFLELAKKIRRHDPQVRLAADLFSGAGGLSLGLLQAGFQVILAADHYGEAVETHSHHFPGLSVDWDLAGVAEIEGIASLITRAGIDLVVGGPPCQPFSKAGRSKIRHRIHHGLRDPHDERRDLWRSFLEVVRLCLPPAVLMENVPDMAFDKEMFILRNMVEELEQLGYSVEEKVVDTWRYGVPQFRQRLILVALRDRVEFRWPDESSERVSVWNAIGDMPEVEGGWRPEGGAHGWILYEGPQTSFQRSMREGVAEADREKLFDHITRPVREDDAQAFAVMDATTKYSDLPAEIKRYRDDIFDDKYKRLDEDDLSRTITAHIAKDGYWYIHPRQNRTLTVREAARLQTFPDWYRFAGPPSAAFRQIGNAVPPLVARRIGEAIEASLARQTKVSFSAQSVAARLADWFDHRRALSIPWLKADTRWQVIAAELLLERAEAAYVRLLWPALRMWETPQALSAMESELRDIGRLIGREQRVAKLLELARWWSDGLLEPQEDELDYSKVPWLPPSVADLATLVVPLSGEDDSDEPVLAGRGVLRVTSRFGGEPVDRKNRLTDGRLSVARMVGGATNFRLAHLGLIELANSLCRPVEPLCYECPVSDWCVSSVAEEQRAAQLF